MGLAETKEAIDAAGKAFKTWSKTTAKARLFSSLLTILDSKLTLRIISIDMTS